MNSAPPSEAPSRSTAPQSQPMTDPDGHPDISIDNLLFSIQQSIAVEQERYRLLSEQVHGLMEAKVDAGEFTGFQHGHIEMSPDQANGAATGSTGTATLSHLKPPIPGPAPGPETHQVTGPAAIPSTPKGAGLAVVGSSSAAALTPSMSPMPTRSSSLLRRRTTRFLSASSDDDAAVLSVGNREKVDVAAASDAGSSSNVAESPALGQTLSLAPTPFSTPMPSTGGLPSPSAPDSTATDFSSQSTRYHGSRPQALQLQRVSEDTFPAGLGVGSGSGLVPASGQGQASSARVIHSRHAYRRVLAAVSQDSVAADASSSPPPSSHVVEHASAAQPSSLSMHHPRQPHPSHPHRTSIRSRSTAHDAGVDGNLPAFPPTGADTVPRHQHGRDAPPHVDATSSSTRPSLFGFLEDELSTHPLMDADEHSEAQHERQTRVYQFFRVPLDVEALVWFGFSVCLDHFLFHFTVVAWRLLVALWNICCVVCRGPCGALGSLLHRVVVMVRVLWHGRHAATTHTQTHVSSGSKATAPTWQNSNRNPAIHSVTHASTDSNPAACIIPEEGLCAILVLSLVTVGVWSLQAIDPARAYHLIKGQSTIKLYVIFNVLEVLDRLCSSFGQDVLDSLFWTRSVRALASPHDYWSRRLGAMLHILVAHCYIVIHASALLFQVVTLNVSVNAHNNGLVALLISNQFIELKGSVFKRFERENLFQISCSDIAERFQLFVFLALIIAVNYDHLSPRLILLVGLIWTAEMAVDMLKHAFITKFNRIPRTVYDRYRLVLSRDVASSSATSPIAPTDPSRQAVHRMGFVALPLVCLVVTYVLQTLPPPLGSVANLMMVAYLIAIAASLKVLFSLHVLSYSYRTCLGMDRRDPTPNTQSLAYPNPSGSQAQGQNEDSCAVVHRYSMFRGRIP